jgi:hypothetical protein
MQADCLPPSSKFLLVIHTALSFGETVWSNFNLKVETAKQFTMSWNFSEIKWFTMSWNRTVNVIVDFIGN